MVVELTMARILLAPSSSPWHEVEQSGHRGAKNLVSLGMMMRGEMRQQQSLTLTPMQRQLVEMIELPDVAMEGYLDEVEELKLQ